MLFDAASRSLTQIFSAPFRNVLWKSLGLTIALFFLLWIVLELVVSTFLVPILGPWPWVTTAVLFALGAGLVVSMGFLIAPVTSVFAGVFLDEIAERVEARHYAHDSPGKELPLGQSIGIAIRFFGLVLLGNFLALITVVFLGFGVIVFFLVNGYLLGREYFQFAALRHVSLQQAEEIRLAHSGTIFAGGLLIALVVSIPVINLLTPLFAAALMTHLYKGLALKLQS